MMKSLFLLIAAIGMLSQAGCAWISKPYRYYDEVPGAYQKGERYECVQDVYLEDPTTGASPVLVPAETAATEPPGSAYRVVGKVSQGTVLEIVRIEERSSDHSVFPRAMIEDGPFKGTEVRIFELSRWVKRSRYISVFDPKYLRRIDEPK